jgi:hypothetical protein
MPEQVRQNTDYGNAYNGTSGNHGGCGAVHKTSAYYRRFGRGMQPEMAWQIVMRDTLTGVITYKK